MLTNEKYYYFEGSILFSLHCTKILVMWLSEMKYLAIFFSLSKKKKKKILESNFLKYVGFCAGRTI